MDSTFYKYCIVPKCKSTSIMTPNKLFVRVPNNEQIRRKWLKLARRDDAHSLSLDSRMYFCEDHFDLPNDMINYMEYHIMGKVSRVCMKSDCIPTKFDCQSVRRKKSYTKEQANCKKQTILIENAITTKHMDFGESLFISSGLPANKEIKTVEKTRPKSKTETKSKSQAKDQLKTSTLISSTSFRVYSDSTKLANNSLPTLCIQPYKSDYVKMNPHYVTETEEIYSEDLIPKSCSEDFKAGVESVIAKVYKFFKEEYTYLVKQYGDSIDLKPFFEYKQRTAAATGASLVTVDRIIQDTTEGRPRKKRKLAKNKASCDADTSATESCEEVRSGDVGNNECDDMITTEGEDFSCPSKTVEDEVWCGMPASSTAETDPMQVVVKIERGDDEENIEGGIFHSEHSHTLTDLTKTKHEPFLSDNSHTPTDDTITPKLEPSDDETYGALDDEAVVQIEKMEFTEEEFT